MAIDTAAKRASAAGFGTFEEHIIPDGTLDQGDRQTMAGCYSGILAAVIEALPLWVVLGKAGGNWATATAIEDEWIPQSPESGGWI